MWNLFFALCYAWIVTFVYSKFLQKTEGPPPPEGALENIFAWTILAVTLVPAFAIWLLSFVFIRKKS